MKLSKEARRISSDLFKASFHDGQLDPGKIRAFAAEIAQGKPRHYIEILKNYHRLIRLELEKRHATIESAAPLAPETSDHVLRDLRARYGQGLTTDFRVNPALIGGLRIRVGSDVWDGSVQGRLDQLDHDLATV